MAGMPGIIENEAPARANRLEAHRQFRWSVGRQRLSAQDVERMVDRLRFTGLDRGLVDEAEGRLRSDPAAGLHWLEERLRELEPRDEPVRCNYCGEVLVEASWRGRATVRCSKCGARWGVEVSSSENSSVWAISGPAEQWLADHPDEEFGEDKSDPADVLIDGLPEWPSDGIPPGGYYPLAMWSDARHGAVLYVRRLMPGEFRLPGDEYEEEIEHLLYDPDEGWWNTGSGGGNWINVFDPPLDLLDKYGVFATGVSGTATADGYISYVGGMCSRLVVSVEATDIHGIRAYPIDKERPFFLVGVYGPSGVVRFLDADGSPIIGRDGSSVELEVS
jgi:hypothetical protein